MKKYILFISIVISAMFAKAQNNVRNLADFNALKVSSAFNIDLIQGTTNQIEIIGVPEEYLGNLVTEINDNTLNIFAKGKIKAQLDMKIKLTFTSLERADISGASSIKNEGVLALTNFEIKTSGASTIDLNLKTSVLNLKTSGASDVKLKGTTQEFVIDASGASSVKTKEFEADAVRVKASGASSLSVNPKNEITGSVSGASDVKVLGNPAINTLTSSGASDIRTSDNLKVNVGTDKVVIEGDEVTITGVGENNVRVVNDTTKVRLGRTNILIINDSISVNRTKKKRRNHWAGIDLGINGFVNNHGSFNLNHDVSLETTNPKKVTQFMELDYEKSWVVNINFFEYFFKIYQEHVGVVTGLGLEYNNYELKHNVRLIPNGGRFVYNNINAYNENYTWGVVDTTLNYSKNRFKTFYVDAPLLFEINTGNKKNKSFHLSAGAIVGYKFTTRMKYVYKIDGNEQKVKDNQDFNTNPFKLSLTARAGIGWVNLFATYSLTPLFENNRGPELYPVSVGVTLLGF